MPTIPGMSVLFGNVHVAGLLAFIFFFFLRILKRPHVSPLLRPETDYLLLELPCYNRSCDEKSSRLPVWRSFTGVKEMGGTPGKPSLTSSAKGAD